MTPALQSLSAFRNAIASGDSLHDIYTTLHVRAAATRAIFISLTPLAQLESRLSTLVAADPEQNLPLHGVPFVVKDNIDVAGHPTTAACPSYSYTPTRSAFVVHLLEQAGAVVLAKSNLDQFATGLVGTRSPYGTPTNPYNPAYIPGGSSSGSAVALAKSLCVFSLGTDTAGSGRVPAAMNRLVGLKPTKGFLSTSGVVPACESLDCVSIFANTVADAAYVLQLASRTYDAANPFTRLPPPARSDPNQVQHSFAFGVPSTPLSSFHCDAIAETSFNESVTRLSQIGGGMVSVDMKPFIESAELLYGGPFVAERYAAVGEFVVNKREEAPADFDPTVATIILNASKGTAVDLFNAQRKVLHNVKIAQQTTWTNIDVLVVPSIPTALTLMDIERDPIRSNSILGTFTNFVNLMDYCAIAIPCPAGAYKGSVPRGITLIAQAFEEEKLVAIARKFMDEIENEQVDIPDSSEAFRGIPETNPESSTQESKQEEQEEPEETIDPKERQEKKPRLSSWMLKVRQSVATCFQTTNDAGAQR